jgi:hypothetical protein
LLGTTVWIEVAFFFVCGRGGFVKEGKGNPTGKKNKTNASAIAHEIIVVAIRFCGDEREADKSVGDLFQY